MPWQLLQQRGLVLEKVVAPKRASCDGNGRVVAAWFVQCFLCCGFLAMFGLAGTVSTPVLDVSVAVHFCWTVCARNLQKAASLTSDFSPAIQHAAQWMLCSQEQECSFRYYTVHVFLRSFICSWSMQLESTAWCRTCFTCSWSDSPSYACCRADVLRHWRRQNPP